jgi:putative Ca2+/H+ antiporter (TMEM165/GDT1 family)
MDLKIMLPVFFAVFLAEIGDKTQLACVLFASDKEAHKLSIFIGASLALIIASAIGVYAGCLISEYFSERQLRLAAGLGFIVMGIWILVRH